MRRQTWVTALIVTLLVCGAVTSPADAKPEGALTVAVATFGNERWLPHLYVGAEDIVLKPLWENLLSRDAKGNLIPMLAERQGRPLSRRKRTDGRRRQVHVRVDRARRIGQRAGR